MIVTSAVPDGLVVSVPRSRTDRTPRIWVRIDSLGIPCGGAEADRAKGFAMFFNSEMGKDSIMVRIVERVPPLGPEVLQERLVCVDATDPWL